MSLMVTVKNGTHAGWRRVNEPGISKCGCGRFISCVRAAAGATLCIRCETETEK